MKVVNYKIFAIAFILMLLASCSDNEPALTLNDTYVKFSISLPKSLGTRSEESLGSVNTLQWSIFEVKEIEGRKEGHHVYSDSTLIDNSSLTQDISLNLAKGGTYKITFCAYNDKSKFARYHEGIIKVDYSEATSFQAEDDMFVGVQDEFTIEEGEYSKTITLKRPFAQLNWASSDLNAPTVTPYLEDATAQVSITSEVYTTLNLLDNEVSESLGESLSFPKINCSNLPASTITVEGQTLKHLAMNYLLLGEETTTINCGMQFEGDKLNISVPVSNASVAADYKTNIYGSLITDPSNINVSTARAFINPNLKIVTTAEEFVEAFNAGNDVEVPEGVEIDITSKTLNKFSDNQTLIIDGKLKVIGGQFEAVSNCKVIIKGSGIITVSSCNNTSIFRAFSGSTLDISDITIKPEITHPTYVIYVENSKLNLNNIKIIGKCGGINSYQNNIITILNSKIQTTTNLDTDASSNYWYPLILQNGSICKIKDSDFEGHTQIDIRNNSYCEIIGGSITTEKLNGIGWNHCIYMRDTSHVNIYSGDYTSCTNYCVYGHQSNNGFSIIKGGKFTSNQDIANAGKYSIPDGYEKVKIQDPAIYMVREKN